MKLVLLSVRFTEGTDIDRRPQPKTYVKNVCRFAGLEKEKWPKRYNCELYEAFDEPNIVNYIKVNRLARAEHLMLMDDDRIRME